MVAFYQVTPPLHVGIEIQRVARRRRAMRDEEAVEGRRLQQVTRSPADQAIGVRSVVQTALPVHPRAIRLDHARIVTLSALFRGASRPAEW